MANRRGSQDEDSRNTERLANSTRMADRRESQDIESRDTERVEHAARMARHRESRDEKLSRNSERAATARSRAANYTTHQQRARAAGMINH